MLVLWLYENDYQFLPESTLKLQKYGLVIKTWPRDIKSYKKLIPSLHNWPDAIHVTADDDIYYPKDWLKTLLTEYNPHSKEVLCLRAHKIKLLNNLPDSYHKWQKPTKCISNSENIVATGVGGILYPPNLFSSEVLNENLFMQLSPTTDDLWFYIMARLKDRKTRVVANEIKFISTFYSKDSLWNFNKDIENGNDAQLKKLIENYKVRFLPDV
jgi:hypothetical protein